MMNSLLFVSYLKESKAMSYAKAVYRTLFYQFFLLFVGLSVGFILNAEYIGMKSRIISQSINNIFFPIKYTEEVNTQLKNFGAFKLWAIKGYPHDFKIIEEAIAAEEWYWAKYSYVSNGKLIIDIDSVRLRWKPWEYYYHEDKSTEELNEYFLYGDLNSKETDRAMKLRQEKKQLLSKESIDK